MLQAGMGATARAAGAVIACCCWLRAPTAASLECALVVLFGARPSNTCAAAPTMRAAHGVHRSPPRRLRRTHPSARATGRAVGGGVWHRHGFMRIEKLQGPLGCAWGSRRISDRASERAAKEGGGGFGGPAAPQYMCVRVVWATASVRSEADTSAGATPLLLRRPQVWCSLARALDATPPCSCACMHGSCCQSIR